jgi:hypothetical protein
VLHVTLLCIVFRQEKQVAKLRERSKLSGYPVPTGEHPDGADTAQQGAQQDSHAPELRNGAGASPGDTQAASDQREGDHDPHGIHHYSQQRPAEVPCRMQLPDGRALKGVSASRFSYFDAERCSA